MIQEEVVSFSLTNTTNGTIPMSIMGNNTDVMDNSNASTRYFWDLTGFTLTNEDTITIQYQYTGQSGFSTASVKVQGTTLQSIADALNTLNIGTFFLTTSGGSTYMNNYNQNVGYGSLNILNTTGIINTTFVVGTGFNSNVGNVGNEGIAIQSDGKILCTGLFTTYQGTTAVRIIRLNTDGSIDTTFSSGTGFDSTTLAIAIQSDGKILVGGGFFTYNGTIVNLIVRLNTNGSIDGTFSSGTGFSSNVNTIEIQSDGKIVVGGAFTTYNGTGANYIIRLNSNGSVDGTFVYGTGFNNFVYDLAIQSDGKIVVSGDFNSYNGTGANRIIRLNTNGSVDGTFVYGTGFNSGVLTTTIQSDGKIVCGGSFTSYNGTGANYIIRLTTLGAVDTTFVYAGGFNASVQAIQVQSDGKIIVGGQFTTYQSTNANRIIRLTSLGAIDTSWVYGTGFNDIVFAIALSFSQIYIGGQFTTFQGQSYPYIISLNQ